MTTHPQPADAAGRRAVAPVVCYPTDTLPQPDLDAYKAAREGWSLLSTHDVTPRDACCFSIPAGHFARIVSVDGPQVGDLNLWCADDPGERFFSGKTRALHGSHVSVGDRLWSNLPHLRPLATVTDDTLAWYGVDAFGCRVHDVIGTRCDPYTKRLLDGEDYNHCCHSNLVRAFAAWRGLPAHEAEPYVHDVLNVFMCTGFSADTGQYVMKASPVRPGDFFEIFAEVDLVGGLSACPGGDCGAQHSSDLARTFPLRVEVYRPAAPPRGWRQPSRSGYARGHGMAGRAAAD